MEIKQYRLLKDTPDAKAGMIYVKGTSIDILDDWYHPKEEVAAKIVKKYRYKHLMSAYAAHWVENNPIWFKEVTDTTKDEEILDQSKYDHPVRIRKCVDTVTNIAKYYPELKVTHIRETPIINNNVWQWCQPIRIQISEEKYWKSPDQSNWKFAASTSYNTFAEAVALLDKYVSKPHPIAETIIQ